MGLRGATQIKYFNSFASADPNAIDVIICDEAHRLWDINNNRFIRKDKRSGLKLVEEILKAAKVAVFFIDDKQIVRPNEIGSVSYIEKFAEKYKCKILNMSWKSNSDAVVRMLL
jgi:predicted oxidoreductase (fatty acid repression mutant protein)